VLYQNVPNPFNPSTVIAFDLPVRRHVKVSIYDAAGRHVAVIMDEVAGPGKATVDWNGTDDAGSSVASGVYFCRLVAGKDVLTRKMTLLR
ncbi:MAG TPA: FlgD immunoglobulin-like domain containing protein, partial [Candidatus Krumholzibacterium sp.]|nr:FlgD immunoglobulin-like domain containing protein [Candidatus Krumholzibacterium sp.]